MKFKLVSGYANKLGRLMFGEKKLNQISSHSHEIAPGKTFLHPAAIFDEKDLSRITGTGPGTTLKLELQKIHEHYIHYPPTIAHTIDELALYNGNFFHKRFKHGVALGKGPIIAIVRTPTITGGVLSQSWLGTRFFGHWLHDDVPLNFTANSLGQAIGVPRSLTEHQIGYSNLFGVKIKELPRFGIVKEITIVDDRGYNDYKRQRLELMRSMVMTRFKSPIHKGVMIIRGTSGKMRNLVNEQEIADHLRRAGFKIIDPSFDRFETIIRSVVNSRIVIGVQGSHLAHGLFGLIEGGSMIQLQPPFEFDNEFKNICDILSIKYGFVVGNSVSDGFRVEIAALDSLLERVLA